MRPTTTPGRQHARDRIGNFIGAANSLDEKGQPVPNTFPGSEHDILTGSTLDGRAYTNTTRDYTCGNWTSAADGVAAARRRSSRWEAAGACTVAP
jgi:hypothetical protein